MRILSIILIGCGLGLAGEAGSQSRPPVAAPRTGRDAPDDVRDVLLLLDRGPLHLRFRITLAGVGLRDARDAYVERLMTSLDTNGDGKLSPDEAARSPIKTVRGPRKGAAFLKTLDGDRIVSRKEIARDVDRAGGEPVVYRQDSTSSSNDLEVFKFLDGDHSGDLDAAEMAAAAGKILARDQDQDECISFEEFLPVAKPDDKAQDVPPRQATAGTRAAATADLLRDTSEPLLARRLLKKYDSNRDSKLTAEELGWESSRIKLLDRDSDGVLDQQELSGLGATPVDLDLSVELAGASDGRGASLAVLSTVGKRVDDARRPDVLRVAFPNAVLTLSFRKIDPIQTAVEKAMQAFNKIDVDGNGYLDAQETMALVRFQLELFDAIDADRDGKIFGEEMEKYVRARGEPAATTARVNLYDTGRGFFEALDTNDDGRISRREIQAAGKSLNSLARKHAEKLAPDDPARNFHVEFLRGSFALFGPGDQMLAPASPSYEPRAPIGPIWFQRMDRNSDGDLTWNEFLGPRDVFGRIDKDTDGMIDAREAAMAGD